MRRYAQTRHVEARQSLQALRAAVTVFSGSAGRTLLLYVGEGFPVDPGGDTYHLLDAFRPSRGSLTEISKYQLRQELEDLVELTNAAGITVSAYDALGLDAGTAMDVDGPSALGGARGFRLDSLRRGSRQAPMATLTNATGGVFARADNTMQQLLGSVVDDLNAYYSVSYTHLTLPTN